MKKIIVFGTGGMMRKTLSSINFIDSEYEIIEFWDNNNKKHGIKINGKKVCAPHTDINFDKIVIASSFYDEIYQQLTTEYNIPVSKIANGLYFEKLSLIEYYQRNFDYVDAEVDSILKYLQINNLNVLNYAFVKKYLNIQVDICYDELCGLFFVMHNNKKMYMKKSSTCAVEI